MGFRFAFGVLLALVAFTAMINSLEAATQVGNDIDDLLRKLKAAVDKAMVQAQAALDEAKAEVQAVADSISAEAESEMQGTEDQLKEELDELKLKAKNAGVNIDDCLGDNENKLVNLPNVYSEDLVHCVSDKVNQGIGYAQDALNKVQKIVDDVENIKQEIKDCGHGLKAVKCLAKLTVKIGRETYELPTEIEADVAATVLLITQLEDKVKQCASDKTSECESEGESLLGTISVCVATKIVT